MPRNFIFSQRESTTPGHVTESERVRIGTAAGIRSKTEAGTGNLAHGDGTSVRHGAAEEEEPLTDGKEEIVILRG